MARSKKVVKASMTNPIYGIKAGKTYYKIKSYFANGEGWYSLIDEQTDRKFECPNIFFA